MSDKDMITSATRRFLKLGGLSARVGASVLGQHALDFARSGPQRQVEKTENLVRNAVRIVETLGELKGAAMKVGQMLSLHEGLLPPEVADVLRSLQKEAPRVPAEVMEYEIRGALDNFDELFARMDFEAFAAASIGQVHRGTLRDGREVAVKIQYPLIDQIVSADLKNLKTLVRSLVGLVLDVDFEPIWTEVRDRLLEELDYTHEAATMRRMSELHADVSDIVIPRVVAEASAKNVLTMEYVGGVPAQEGCSNRFGQNLRNRWGTVLCEFLLRGLFEHRFLHADPNLANFAFLDDGRVVVYDFGCVKRIPQTLASGYAELLIATLERRKEAIPEVLGRMGVGYDDGSLLSRDLTDPYVDLLAPIVRKDPPYTFGEDEALYRRLFELGIGNWSHATGIRFPEDAIFVDRALGGHFGNLCKLNARGPWRDLVVAYASAALA